MTTWCFRLLAVPLLVSALSIVMMRPDVASAETPPASAQNFSTQNYGAIAKTALSMLHQQRGQCFPWVRGVVQSALGRVMGNDYHHGYLQAGGIEVPLVSARNGDIIQVTNPANTAWDADYPGLHTAIVLDNLGNGKFRVIDSNSEYDGVVRVRDNYNPAELSTRQPGRARLPDRGRSRGRDAGSAAHAHLRDDRDAALPGCARDGGGGW
jgi:hypothetical protein